VAFTVFTFIDIYKVLHTNIKAAPGERLFLNKENVKPKTNYKLQPSSKFLSLT